MKKLIVLGAVTTAVLVACGGGGSDSGVTAPAGPNVANAFAGDAGIYRFNCQVIGTVTIPVYSNVIVMVDAPTGSEKAKVTVQSQDFDDAACATAPTFDITVRGDLSALAETKTISGINGAKSGTAKTAEFTLTTITLTLPNGLTLADFPAFGTKAKVGYLIEGNKVYGLSGSNINSPDRLPTSFSKNFLIKQ